MKSSKPIIWATLLFTIYGSTSFKNKPVDYQDSVPPTNKVVLRSEIVWEKLSPARGDASPQAGTIWGDRNGTGATGFLAKFAYGFSSPPHIHNVTHRCDHELESSACSIGRGIGF